MTVNSIITPVTKTKRNPALLTAHELQALAAVKSLET